MIFYRRNFMAGGSFFVTVNLAERRLRLLTQHIDALRSAFRQTRKRHPFTIDAMVVLPDHLHTVWTLPERDADFVTRWRLIKSAFSDYVDYGDSTLNRIAELLIECTVTVIPYVSSPATIREIVSTGRGVPDPGGVPGAFRYDVPGTFSSGPVSITSARTSPDTRGVYELVINPVTNVIYHFQFRGGR